MLIKIVMANPFIAEPCGYISHVVQGRETPKRICLWLAMLANKKIENPWRKHGNIPL